MDPFKIFEPAIDLLWDQGIKQTTYIFCYKKNVVGLRKRVKRLGDTKERLYRQRDQAKSKGDIVEPRVEEWFEEVGEFETRVRNYWKNAGHKKTRGFYYLFPYYRHKLGRLANKMETEALQLVEDSPTFDEVSHAKKVTSFDLTSSNPHYIEFDCRKSIMKDIMTKLEDPTVKIIGVHGPQGVGKSTLITEIANKARHEELFDKVAQIDVTANPNPLKIQEEIAYVLGLSLEGESENVRADCLRRWLKIENVSILIILDNLYERLDLNRLGIPVDDEYNLRKRNLLSTKSSDDKQGRHLGQKDGPLDRTQGTDDKLLKKANFLGDYKGCKILLSSRDKKVFSDNVQSNFNLKELDDNDALMLFDKEAGGGNQIFMPKEEIQNYCAGLPMRIVTFAATFKSWSESVSEPTLDKFKKQGLVEWKKSMEIPGKIKYDLPKSEELKFIYLLCAQMGHLPLVMDLVKYCFGLGILEGVSSLSAARRKINKLLDELKDLGLVLYESPNIHFNMPHMVREDALSNAYKDHNAFVLRDGKLNYWSDLKECAFISICNSDIIDGLPEHINCPQLQFLQIETNDPSLKIPERFFHEMKNLRVLILIGFCLSSLPSIESILELRMLCLERCTLNCDLSVVGNLKKLRILSFSGSQLKSLPAELQHLDKLRLLDISDCFELRNIPPNLISSLTCLEELYVRKSLIKMLVEAKTNKGQNSFLSELKNLHHLKVVDLSIPYVSIFSNHLFFDKLKDYKIEIGDFEMFPVGEFRMPNKYEELKVLALQLKDGIDIHSQKGIKLLFKTVQSLLLGKVGVQNVVNELNVDGFPDLKHLSIINNNDVKYVSSTELSNSVNIFPNLESLCLYSLMNLKMICCGPVTVTSFAKLKTIKIDMCHQLKNVFSFYTIKISTGAETSEISECNSYLNKFLANLEMIEVGECGTLEEILQIQVDYGKVEFLKLHTLTLQSLPSFTSFNTKVERSCWSHLIEAQSTTRSRTEISPEEDDHSDKAPPLFDELVEIPNLKSLNLSSLNIHKIWSDQHLSSFCFQNLIKLVVKDCYKLTHLCSLTTGSSLKMLKSLIMSGCPTIEKIFKIEGVSANKVCVFPKLEEIHLSKMNRLTDIWETKVSVDSFSSLISVSIEECNHLDKIFPSHMEGWFESLINLKVFNCKSVKEVFEINDSQERDASGGIDINLQVILLEGLPKLKHVWSKDPNGILNFKKLRTIDVSYCDELRNLFPASVAKDISKLERVSAFNCKKMVEIVANKDASEANDDSLEFPELIFVRLYGLPNMKQFYKSRYPIKCPKLKELSMGECVKLKTFFQKTSERTDEEEKNVFPAETVFPNLEYMEIDMDEAQNLLPKYQMHRLKELIILKSVQRKDLLHPFLYRMPNLEKLKLNFSGRHGVPESVPSTNIAPLERLGTVLQLKQLVLLYSDIEDLGFERDQVLRRLELLKLKDCDKLKNLGPPSVSLSYLTCLKLKYCWGLRNLMASSTAKSMVQLKTMKVIYCGNLHEIVSNEGSEDGKVMKIVFSKLVSIELVGLEKMRSFCSYKECEFEFPSLEILIVRECSKMEKFSERGSITPKLKSVFGVKGDEKAKWQWEGDLNATIQKVFNDKVSLAYTEYLNLYYYTKYVKQLWYGRHWVQQNSFGYLKRLSAWGCHSLVHVIPSHLLSCFHNLEELDVGYCAGVQVIFNINDENRLTKASGIFRLKTIFLCNLSKLEHVWDKDPEGIIGLQLLKEMRVEDCESLESFFPASVAKDLTRLQVLKVKRCNKLAEIFRKEEMGEEGEGTTQEFSFPRLTSLTLEELSSLKFSVHCSKNEESISNLSERDVQVLCLGSRPIPNSCFGLLHSLTMRGCHFLSDVLLPLNLLPFLTNLETLEVQNCDSVKAILDVNSTTRDTLISFPLKKLVLSNLPNLENVWNEDPHGILSMHHLQEVHVKICKGLKSVFPQSVAKDIMELENLEVGYCEGLMTIFAEDNNTDPNLQVTFPCPFVRSLKPQGLPKFKYFYYCSLKSDKFYTHLESHTENEVGTEKLLKCLLLGEKGVEMILRGEFQRNLLHNLEVLTLYFRIECDEFPEYGFLQQLPNVKKLVVCNGSFKEMFCGESPSNVDYSGLLLQLKEFRLESLGKLVSIGLEKSWTESFVRNVETFEIIRCSSLKSLVACKVSFFNLTCLKVQSCGSLSYLFTSSTARSLTQLQRMEIIECGSIEEIVSKEESDEDEIIFPQLICLNLENLWNLLRFYRGSLNFPLLEELSITYCDKMVTLCRGTLEAAKVSKVTINEEESIRLKTDLRSTILKAFMRKTLRESPVHLKRRPGLQEIWHSSLHIPHFTFSKLATLIVYDCEFLSDAVLPFHLFPLLLKLETLEVQNCDSVKTIFEVKSTAQGTLITFPLKTLTLSKLPNLKNVWNEDPHEILSMHHLQNVYVGGCKGLKSVFPQSVAKDIVELENLEVGDCEGLITIVAEDNTDPSLKLTFPCPSVRSLKLRALPNFKYFYYSVKSYIYTHLESHTEDHLRIKKCLLLTENGVDIILRGEFQRDLLHNLKTLTLCFDSDVFGYQILEQVPNIEKLVLCDGSLREVFCCESPNNVDYNGLLLQLKVLHLVFLQELVAWRLPFSNLTCLKVESCNRQRYLLTSSTARSLTQLQRMEIERCESIEEIVSKEESDEDKIIFRQLSYLKLENLENLRRFYRGSLSFPLLEELSITSCYQMVTLCAGTLKANKLSQVTINEKETIPLENDKLCKVSFFNLTCLKVESCGNLSYLFKSSRARSLTQLQKMEIKDCESIEEIVSKEESNEDEIIFPRLTCLNLENLENLRRFYRGSLSFPLLEKLSITSCYQMVTLCAGTLKANKLSQVTINEEEAIPLENDVLCKVSFSNLTSLKVENCNSSSYLLTSSTARSLTQLQKMEIKECKSIEEIVFKEESDEDEIIFPQLSCLKLENLENLRRLYRGRLSFPLLEKLSITCCNKMVTLCASSVKAVKCSQVTINGEEAIPLENDVLCKVSFSNLTSLKVENLNSSSYLFTSSTARSLTQLQRMKIKECYSIEEIVFKEEGEESDEGEIIFPQLSCLNLENLKNLRRFYRGSLSFPLLEELLITCCKKMVTLCATVKAGKCSQVTIDNTEYIPLETDLNPTIMKGFLVEATKWNQRLEFEDRPDLQEIWRVSVQIPHFYFSRLKTLIVDGCYFLSYALPFTLLPLLPELQTLQVRNCHSIKSIFDVQCAQNTLTFPLKELVLWNLPDLETVWNEYPAETVTEANPPHPKETTPKLTLPTVTSLTLWDLPKFKHNTIHCIHDATPKLITPNLEHLTVGENELKMIVDGEFQRNLLNNLKALTLSFHIEYDEFPEYGFLQVLPNVKKLVVCDGSFKVIFCEQRSDDSEDLLQLKELCLEYLEELVSIGLENSWTEPFVKNLETFDVIGCSRLQNLVSCRVSFSNLICLKVENCDSLSYLFTSSTAKSLVQLQRMEIKECESIEEIVSKEEGEESDEDQIIFPQLSCLNLENLENLRRFFRGSLILPLLKELSIRDCDEMVSLCAGTLEAVKLSQVTINYKKDIPLETDLNSTLMKEFLKKTVSESYVYLKRRPGLQEIWHSLPHIPDFCFSNLATLIMYDCQFLSDAGIPFNFLPLLPVLETLKVGNCNSVKTIFDVKSTKGTLITFPLKKLVLSKLPNLENVWNEDPHGILCMKHLEKVYVEKCKGLTSVFPASVAKDLMKLEHLVVKDCERLTAIVAEECDEDEEIIFERLQVLDLKRLQELRCFYAGNFTLSFASLEEVHVIECSSMKTFSAVNKIDHPTKWYCSEYETPRRETDLNSAVRRTSEEEASDASSAFYGSDTDEDSEHGDD